MISSPRSNSDIFLAKFSANGTDGALARLGSVSTVNSLPNSNYHFFIDSSDKLYISGVYSANLFGFYPSSNTNTPSMFVSSLTATSFSINTYTAIVDNGLSTISLGRLEWPDVGSSSLYPMSFTKDTNGNCIVTTNMYPNREYFAQYTLGNNTSTPDIFVSTGLYAGNTLVGLYGTPNALVSKITSNVTTSWSAVSVPGLRSSFPYVGTMYAGDDTAALVLGSRIGPIAIGSDNRIFTSAYTSTLLSTIVFDKYFSTVSIFQQITGSSVNASTIGAMLSYPSDGINRLQ